MTEYELLTLIHGGENIRVEFKKSTNEITRDVYDTVCSFSNRDGGIIILGVKDNGEILGIIPDAVDRMKKDFVTSINNGQKINPPLYLQPETYQIEGRTLLVIQVPVSSQVCRHRGRIFDRNHESDIDITDNSDMVYQLYARKSGSYFVNKVTRFQLSDLRSDLIERARTMTSSRTANHPWKSMSDEEMLHSAGLILKDEEKQMEGITLAAILLFGKDSTIMSVLPQHKTDAIFRVENLDRYDDRDVIITNLLETYDRLIAFGQKHLSDPFVQDDVFRTIVPLAPVAIEKVGPQEKTQVTTQVKTQVTTQVTITDKILVFCLEPHSKAEIAEHCGYKNTKNFTQKYLRPLLDTGKLQMTIPDKPRSQNQKYITSER